MANKLPCGMCAHYYEQVRPLRKGGTVSLKRGHCLDKTIYASNKPGEHVYPPDAKQAELPYGVHRIELVTEQEVRPHCLAAKER